MEITLGSFFTELAASPLLIFFMVLVIGVIVVNGATDASNAIATVISTRSLGPNASIIMAATMNFIGLLLMTLATTAVAHTIANMVDFGGNDQAALWGLSAAMIAIIVWGAVAWYFGIPTSQSHSLIAGLTGAAIGLQGGLDGIVWGQWAKVIYGLAVSTLLGFVAGWLISKALKFLFRNADRRRAEGGFGIAQILAAAGLAFMHGAQDGQKFMSIAMMGITLAVGMGQAEIPFPLWLMILCSLTMGLGTAVGGKRIIKSVAMDMVHFEKYEGFAASLAACLCLVLATFTGLPVSTTHTKTTAIMGVGAAKRVKAVKWTMAKDMVLTWVATFPGCGIIAFALSLVFVNFL
jgi:PiT family inorganic phosphate transporter